MLNIDQLNKTNTKEFTDLLGGIFEHSPWIAEKAAKLRPFSSISHLHQQMVEVVKNSTYERQLDLIKAHPNLGDRVKMSKDSTKEQQGAGLKDLTAQEYKNFLSLNQQYMQKFGFPFIIAVKGNDKQTIYQEMKNRMNNDTFHEFQTALSEIYKIAAFRLQEKLNE